MTATVASGRGARTRWAVAALCAVVAAGLVAVVPAPPSGGLARADAASFLSLVPGRVLETRSGLSTVDGQANGIGLRAAGSETPLKVAGRAGVPAGAKAVVLNVAVTGSFSPGFVTVWPCGSARPNASSLNYDAGETISNAVTAQIGTNGEICIFTFSATHVIVDVTGAYPSTAGFQALVPGRILETRAGLGTVDGQFNGIGILAGGTVTELAVRNRAGAGNADAVVLNVAVTGSTFPGFVTVFPCGTARPNASSLNYDAGQTISNAVTAKVGTGGAVCIFVYSHTHVIIDLTGAFPAGAGYVALVPGRVMETRAGLGTVDGQSNGIGIRPAGSETDLFVAGRAGVGPVDAVVLNVAVTGSSAPGFVTIFPCGSARPNASSLNFAAGQTISNAVTSKVGVGGRICIYVFAATHVIIDVTGYFPGTVVADPNATTTSTTTAPNAKRRLQAVYLLATNSGRVYSVDHFKVDIGRVTDWYKSQTGAIGGRYPDFVKDAAGAISVITVQSTKTTAQLQPESGFYAAALEIAARPDVAGNYPIIFYEGRAGPGCGVTYEVGFVLIPSLNCGSDPSQADTFGFPYGFTLVIAHEIGHAMVGFGTCGATFSGGHDTAFPNDLMYSGPLTPAPPIILDVGNDSYYNHNKACADMKNSPLLTK